MGPDTLKLGKHTPGSCLGYTWERAGQVLDVDVDAARSMIPASHGDIYEVLPSVDESERDDDTVVAPKPAPRKRVSTPKADLTEALGASSVTTPKG